MSGASTKPTLPLRRDRMCEAFSRTWFGEASSVAQLGVDGGGVARGQRLVAHQAVHVDPVALVGGHAARARVRMGRGNRCARGRP